jgi:hypothetical protein
MRGFRRRGDELVAEVTPAEAQAIALMITRVAGLIEHEVAVGAPRDPALVRLFPDGYRDDPAAAAELRELTEGDLREQKLQNARTVLGALPPGGEIWVDAEEADVWLMTLNDARLAIGEWLGITADTDFEAEFEETLRNDPSGERAFVLAVQDLLSYLVESLARALTE